ncbi:hypothetical protein D3C81_1376770 [compost metagenome]
MAGVAEHGVPARVAINVAGVGIPVPDAVADQFEQGQQLLLTEAGGCRRDFLNHECSPAQRMKDDMAHKTQAKIEEQVAEQEGASVEQGLTSRQA